MPEQIEDFKYFMKGKRVYSMIFEKLKAIIEENSTVEDVRITQESKLQDLSNDSLEEVDILIKIEKAFGIKIDLRKKLLTVSDLIEYIESRPHEEK